jgi:hypothetical protein
LIGVACPFMWADRWIGRSTQRNTPVLPALTLRDRQRGDGVLLAGPWRRLVPAKGAFTRKGRFVRRFAVLLGFWALLWSATATLDDAITHALEVMSPYAKQGYLVRTDDEWGGDLGVKEPRAIPLGLFGGHDYRFCVGTDVDAARLAVHVCDQNGKRVENEAYQGRVAAARVVTPATGTYFIIVEVTSSPVERTHWAMVYGAKRTGSPNGLSGP